MRSLREFGALRASSAGQIIASGARDRTARRGGEVESPISRRTRASSRTCYRSPVSFHDPIEEEHLWSRLFDFMRARGRKFEKNVVGVPREAIETLEAKHGVKLPELYVDFLHSMGDNADRFTPFGGHDTNFGELFKRLPTKLYPCTQYWQITRHVGADIEIEPIFLDLTRAAGNATPLVTLSFGLKFDPATVEDVGSTLQDAFVSQAFRIFELAPKPCKRDVHAYPESSSEAQAVAEQAGQELIAMGLNRAFTTPMFVCFTDGDRAAQIEIYSETLVTISLGGRSNAEVARTGGGLVATLPNAKLL